MKTFLFRIVSALFLQLSLTVSAQDEGITGDCSMPVAQVSWLQSRFNSTIGKYISTGTYDGGDWFGDVIHIKTQAEELLADYRNSVKDRGRWDYLVSGSSSISGTNTTPLPTGVAPNPPCEICIENVHNGALYARLWDGDDTFENFAGVTKSRDAHATDLALAVKAEILFFVNDSRYDASDTNRFDWIKLRTDTDPYFQMATKIDKQLRDWGRVIKTLRDDGNVTQVEEDAVKTYFLRFAQFFGNRVENAHNVFIGNGWRSGSYSLNIDAAYGDGGTYAYQNSAGTNFLECHKTPSALHNNRWWDIIAYVGSYGTYYNDTTYKDLAFDCFKVYMKIGVWSDGTMQEWHRQSSGVTYGQGIGNHLVKLANDHAAAVQNGFVSGDIGKYYDYTTSEGSTSMFGGWVTDETDGGNKGIKIILETLAKYYQNTGGHSPVRYIGGAPVPTNERHGSTVFSIANSYYQDSFLLAAARYDTMQGFEAHNRSTSAGSWVETSYGWPWGKAQGNGIWAEAPDFYGDSESPSEPNNLRENQKTHNTIKIDWDASSDNVGITGYKILLNNLEVATTTALTYEFTGLTPSSQYSITVIALDAAGNQSTPATISSSTESCSEGSIIPQYQLDGVWQSGENNLTVDKGTEVVLSMLPDTIALESLELPDGTIVGDNHNLGMVTPDDNGSYILTSIEGCTTTIVLTVSEGPTTCPGTITNENSNIALSDIEILNWSNGGGVVMVTDDTNGSECAMKLDKSNPIDDYAYIRIPIERAGQIETGDELFLSLDAKVTSGNAKLVVTTTADFGTGQLVSHFFQTGIGWTTLQEKFTVPASDSGNLYLWIAPNNGNPAAAESVYDNLIIRKVRNCSNSNQIENDDPSISLSDMDILNWGNGGGVVMVTDDTNGSECAMKLDKSNPIDDYVYVRIPIDMAANQIETGDELFLSLDAKVNSGNAKLVVTTTDSFDTGQLVGHFFQTGIGWTSLEEKFTVPANDSGKLYLWIAPNIANSAPAESIYDNLMIRKVRNCSNSGQIENEDPSIRLSSLNTQNWRGSKVIEMVTDDTNGSECAMKLQKLETGDQFGAARIAVNLAANNLGIGDELYFSLDAKVYGGNAQVVVSPYGASTDNPMATFAFDSDSWTSKNHTFTITELAQDILTIWFFPNRGGNDTSDAVFDNLVLHKVKGCSNSNQIENEDPSIRLSSLNTQNWRGSKVIEMVTDDTNGSECAMKLQKLETGDQFGAARIAVNLAANNLGIGDELYFSLDARVYSGNAQVVVSPYGASTDNSMATFVFDSDSWTSKNDTFTITELAQDILTIWFFPNRAGNDTSDAVFDNLIIRKTEAGSTQLKTSLDFEPVLESDQPETIRVFPNPGTYNVNVMLPLGKEYTLYNLYSINGSLVKEGTIEKDQSVLPITIYDIKNGLYLLNLINRKGESAFVKVVKE